MYLTCSFKLHDPSKRKRVILEYALEEYTKAFKGMLESCDIDLIADLGNRDKEGNIRKYTKNNITKLLEYPKDIPLHSSFKASLLYDVAENLASYFELREMDKRTSFPVILDYKVDYVKALEDFSRVGSSLTDYNESRDNLLRVSKHRTLPLAFEASGTSKFFCIVTNLERTQFFAVLWLLPAGHDLAQSIDATQGNLVRIDTGEVFTSKSKLAIIVPIEVGRNGWQYEKFLQAAMNGETAIKTANLVKKDNGEYFLNVAFKFDEPKPYQPETYIGVDRGVFFSMAYAMVDKEGKILTLHANDDGFREHTIGTGIQVADLQKRGKIATLKDYKRKQGEAILHSLVNEIIAIALEYKSMIVLEDLNIMIRGKFYKSAWKKMYSFFEYKCKMNGVPLYKGGIFAANTSKICIYCGELNHERKRDGTPFDCPHCEAVYHSDAGAGINIARRAMYKKADWEKNGGYLAFHKSFATCKPKPKPIQLGFLYSD